MRFQWAVTCLLFLLLTSTSIAGSTVSKMVPTYSGRYATLKFEVAESYTDLQAKIAEKLGEFFRAGGYLRDASVVSSAAFREKSSTTDSVSTSRTSGLLISFLDERILPPSYFRVVEDRVQCRAGKICSPNGKWTITGPIAVYSGVRLIPQPRVAASHTSPGRSAGATPISLKDSFDITLEVRPAGVSATASEVVLRLNINSANYMGYMGELQRRNLVASIPTEDGVNIAFLMWAQNMVRRFFHE